MGVKGEVAKKGQVAVTRIIRSVIVFFYPARQFLDTVLRLSLYVIGFIHDFGDS
jgi:hypothetical protein